MARTAKTPVRVRSPHGAADRPAQDVALRQAPRATPPVQREAPAAMPDECGIFSPEAYADLSDRLKRIEGQVRGIQRMVDDGRDCRAILNQLTAVRSAAYQVSLLLVRDYASQCLRDSEEAKGIDDLVQALNQLPY